MRVGVCMCACGCVGGGDMVYGCGCEVDRMRIVSTLLPYIMQNLDRYRVSLGG